MRDTVHITNAVPHGQPLRAPPSSQTAHTYPCCLSLPPSLVLAPLLFLPQGLCTHCLLYLESPFPCLATGPTTDHSGLGLTPPLQRGLLTQRCSLAPAPVLILCPKCLTFVYFFLVDWFIISTACKLPESRLLYLSHSLPDPQCLEQYPGHCRNLNNF